MTPQAASERPSLTGIEAAAAQIRPYLPETPLIRSEGLSRALRADVWLKVETMSPIGSFKLRGAINALIRARVRARPSGAVTSSTGNHGQGVAYAARLLGLTSDIFLPPGANPRKRAMIRAFGGHLHETGRDVDEAKEAARAFAETHGHVFIDDGESLDLMEGAGTVGLEVALALPGVDVLIVPMGSGTLVSGSAAALKAIQPDARVHAVQATGAPAMAESFRARRSVEREITDTLADGLICRVPAKLALAAVLDLVDKAGLVTEEALLAAVHTLLDSGRVLVEPSGAAALAHAWMAREELEGRRVVLVLSGANIAPEALRRAIASPQLIPPEFLPQP